MHRGRCLTAVVTIATIALFAWGATRCPHRTAPRGKYLVNLGLCTDCHTPGYFFGKPDEKRFLGGSEVGFEIPELGVFHGRNRRRIIKPVSATGRPSKS